MARPDRSSPDSIRALRGARRALLSARVGALRMVPLVTAASSFEAKILAARLGSEGFIWELRGNVDGPYPLGQVTVLVPDTELDEVRALLLADEVEDALRVDDGPDR